MGKSIFLMAKRSGGILLFRFLEGEIQFFLVHPGGPFWKNKDLGAWSIPKGEIAENEAPLEAACREFKEETGTAATGKFIPLSPVTQRSGKLVFAWALQMDIDAQKIKSNLFELEWPPKSGIKQNFPEIDKAAWFNMKEAQKKILPAQSKLLIECEQLVSNS